MITCGVEIRSNEAILCLLSKDKGLFSIIDCRQIRLPLLNDQDAHALRKYQFTLKKLFDDYKVDQVVVRERPTKGKFAGASIGFKIEAVLQLIDSVSVHLMSNSELKNRLQETPLPIAFADTGLRAFQEGAFNVAFAAAHDQT